MWAADENIRVIFSQHKRRSTRRGTDVLVFVAQVRRDLRNSAELLWPCRGPRSLRFIGGYMLAKHLDNAMLHLILAKSDHSVIPSRDDAPHPGFVSFRIFLIVLKVE